MNKYKISCFTAVLARFILFWFIFSRMCERPHRGSFADYIHQSFRRSQLSDLLTSTTTQPATLLSTVIRHLRCLFVESRADANRPTTHPFIMYRSCASPVCNAGVFRSWQYSGVPLRCRQSQRILLLVFSLLVTFIHLSTLTWCLTPPTCRQLEPTYLRHDVTSLTTSLTF